MGSSNVQKPGRAAWELARRDHNVVTHAELRALGFSPQAIHHRVRIRRLHPLARGVYAVGTPELTRYGRWMAAVKTCGEAAVLSHLSAAVLWGIWKREARRITLTVPPHRNPRPEGARVYRRLLAPSDVTRTYGIPVTTPLQTLIDCATVCDLGHVERLVNNADARNLLRVDVLREELDGRAGQRGVPQLLEILDRDTFVLTDSALERLFVPIARRAGLEKPRSQVDVNGHRVDFYFPSLDLVIECDSLRYHRTPYEQRKDRLRDQAHTLAETPWLRFTHWQVARERPYVERVLAGFSSPARRPGRPRAA